MSNPITIVLHFKPSDNGGFIAKTESGKVCFPDNADYNSKGMKEGRYECKITKSFEKFNIVKIVKWLDALEGILKPQSKAKKVKVKKNYQFQRK